MKTLLHRTLCCALLCSAFGIGKSHGQCNGHPYSTLSYDVTFVGPGTGNGTYAIPQFNPSSGTLYSVDFDAEIYFNFNYTLSNVSSVPEDRTLSVRRRDLLTATSPSNPSPIQLLPTAWYERIYEHDALSGSGVPPGTSSYARSIYNPKIIDSNFSKDVVPYMGNDYLYLNYTALTQDAFLYGSSDVSTISKSIYDSMVFKITYNYCPAVTLPSTFINLAAQPQGGNMLLNWTTQQNLTAGSFELLMSVDGRTYNSINKQTVNVNSLAGYNYLYKPTAKDPTKAFFRIKQTDQNGNVTYSKVITVILPSKNSSGSVEEGIEKDLVVYPTIPTGNFINVFIPSGSNTDEWTISIISLAGKVMQQSKFSKTNLAKIDFTQPLTPGMYIVDAYNSRTQQHFKDKIVVQR